MTEKQNDLDNGQEVENYSLGDAIARISEAIALQMLEDTLNSGVMIHIPSLGLVITPDRTLKEVKDLTEEELKRNPHIK